MSVRGTVTDEGRMTAQRLDGMGAATRLTGELLYAEIVAAADRSGASVRAFVAPLFNGASWKLEQLRIAKKPTPDTVARVRALIAGEPLPAIRRAKRGHVHRATGAVRVEGELVPARDIIDQRRELAERAFAERRGGETLHDAVRRIGRTPGAELAACHSTGSGQGVTT